MSKKKVTAPLTYNPGKGRPKEHLAYLNWQEMEALKRLNGGNMERGPKGLPSFPPSGTTGRSSSSTGARGPTGPSGQARSSPAGDRGGAAGSTSRTSTGTSTSRSASTSGRIGSAVSGARAGTSARAASVSTSVAGSGRGAVSAGGGRGAAPRSISGVGSPNDNAARRAAESANSRAAARSPAVKGDQAKTVNVGPMGTPVQTRAAAPGSQIRGAVKSVGAPVGAVRVGVPAATISTPTFSGPRTRTSVLSLSNPGYIDTLRSINERKFQMANMPPSVVKNLAPIGPQLPARASAERALKAYEAEKRAYPTAPQGVFGPRVGVSPVVGTPNYPVGPFFGPRASFMPGTYITSVVPQAEPSRSYVPSPSLPSKPTNADFARELSKLPSAAYGLATKTIPSAISGALSGIFGGVDAPKTVVAGEKYISGGDPAVAKALAAAGYDAAGRKVSPSGIASLVAGDPRVSMFAGSYPRTEKSDLPAGVSVPPASSYPSAPQGVFGPRSGLGTSYMRDVMSSGIITSGMPSELSGMPSRESAPSGPGITSLGSFLAPGYSLPTTGWGYNAPIEGGVTEAFKKPVSVSESVVQRGVTPQAAAPSDIDRVVSMMSPSYAYTQIERSPFDPAIGRYPTEGLVPSSYVSTAQPPQKAEQTVTVKRGDTLNKIASENGVTVSDIMNANPQIMDKNRISVGEKISIPTRVRVESFEEGSRDYVGDSDVSATDGEYSESPSQGGISKDQEEKVNETLDRVDKFSKVAGPAIGLVTGVPVNLVGGQLTKAYKESVVNRLNKYASMTDAEKLKAEKRDPALIGWARIAGIPHVSDYSDYQSWAEKSGLRSPPSVGGGNSSVAGIGALGNYNYYNNLGGGEPTQSAPKAAEISGSRPAIHYMWDLGVNIPSPSDPNYTDYQKYLTERLASQRAMGWI